MYKEDVDYGTCSDCGVKLEPVFFIDEEEEISPVYPHSRIKTGRTRRAVDYLVCPICLCRECVDDSFDTPWLNRPKEWWIK